MKRLIYTAVFGGYDRVYPPLRKEAGVDYVIITDAPDLVVPGWTVHQVDASAFAAPKAANLYYRALIHRVLPGYDASLYVDGNIRLIGDTRPLFEALDASGAALAAFSHPRRTRVAEEVEAVIAQCKVHEPTRVRQEFASYLAAGFPDTAGLTENGVLLKDHRHPELDAAMALWWKQFSAHLTRDQISLPFVLWKTGLPVLVFPTSFRSRNPFFAGYPHLAGSSQPAWLVHLCARSHESIFYMVAFRALRRAYALAVRARSAISAAVAPGIRR